MRDVVYPMNDKANPVCGPAGEDVEQQKTIAEQPGSEQDRVERLVRLRLPESRYRYPRDVVRIQLELGRMGYTASQHDIHYAYAQFCEEEWHCNWIAVGGPIVSLESAADAVFRRMEKAI